MNEAKNKITQEPKEMITPLLRKALTKQGRSVLTYRFAMNGKQDLTIFEIFSRLQTSRLSLGGETVSMDKGNVM